MDYLMTAEQTCVEVRDETRIRGDMKYWMASFDGFYLTCGRYSSNCSATLHDYRQGRLLGFVTVPSWDVDTLGKAHRQELKVTCLMS